MHAVKTTSSLEPQLILSVSPVQSNVLSLKAWIPIQECFRLGLDFSELTASSPWRCVQEEKAHLHTAFLLSES